MKLLAQLAKFLNKEEVEVAKRQVDLPSNQDKGQSNKNGSKENQLLKLNAKIILQVLSELDT